ncbi:MAG: hypothetical protein NXH90_07800 [Flavobacteriaceae bacterium]|nr:hypothetical protein [Flavobacteriaceae bacterium]
MKKDIEIPVAKDVHVAVIREWNDGFLSKDWNVYLLTTPPPKVRGLLPNA